MMRTRRWSVLLFLLVPLALLPISGWSAPSSSRTVTLSAGRPSEPDPVIQEIISQVTQEEFTDIDGGLSGEHPIVIGPQTVTLNTRYTPSAQGTLAEQYVFEYFQSLGLNTQYQTWNNCSITGRNVIAEIPGSVDPSRIYLITGHLDSISPNPTTNAKGADDNGSGTTAVMMAARILRNYTFDYTLRFVAFTGEERGLCGSNRYAYASRQANEDIRGVLNLDMIAYDGDGIMDVELHAGTRADSQAVASLFAQNITDYGLNLIPHIYTSTATTASDHASFWNFSYPAILGIESYRGGDFNPWYHSYTCCDTMSHVSLPMAQNMTKAGLATVAMLAVVHTSPQLTPTSTMTPLPPTVTATVAPPTETPAPPTLTPAPPTETPEPGTATPCAIAFSDVHPSDYFYQAVQYLACRNVVTGYADGTFRPYTNTTRGQLTKIVTLAIGWNINTAGGPHFSDVPVGSTFYDYVETAYSHSVISGYADGTFRPGNNVTRGQLAKIVRLAWGWPVNVAGGPHFSDVAVGSTFYGDVETCFNRGLISGYADGTFRPGNSATRGQISKIVYTALMAP